MPYGSLDDCPLADDGLPDIRYLVGTPTGPRTPVFVYCPAHDDRSRPNLAVYPDGTYCFACGFRESREAFVERLRSGKVERPDRQETRPDDSCPPFSHIALKLWHRTLISGPRRHRLSFFLDRGLTEQTVVRFALGHTGYRFSLPVWYGREIVGVQYRMDPFYADPEESRYLSAAGSRIMIARPNPLGRPTVICEGLLDAYLLAQYGIDAVTTTGGAGSLELVLRERLPGRCFVMTDLDEAGDAAWKRLSEKRPWLRRVTWPSGKDITEALSLLSGEKRAEQLYRWIQEALSSARSHLPNQ